MTNLPQRRVAGAHDIRLDGMVDLLGRAAGASVLDLGCNRGRVSDEFARNGARMIHGCDIDADCINVCRHVFADLRSVESRFEVVDLTGGPQAMTDAFADHRYDIVVMLATYHKIKRVMNRDLLSDLIMHLGKRTQRYFAWRGTSNQAGENEAEMASLDRDLGRAGLKRVHTSYISSDLGMCAVWCRAEDEA